MSDSKASDPTTIGPRPSHGGESREKQEYKSNQGQKSNFNYEQKLNIITIMTEVGQLST